LVALFVAHALALEALAARSSTSAFDSFDNSASDILSCRSGAMNASEQLARHTQNSQLFVK
jgi:hypothetical protein